MGLWALAGGLNNLWYSNITACRMNDALQCLYWGVINIPTINNNYKKKRENKRTYADQGTFIQKVCFSFWSESIGVFLVGWAT